MRMTHYFRVKHAKLWPVGQHPRFGQFCKVLVRGRNGNVAVEFEDGHRLVTTRWGIRRRREVR
jgi:hypothetical protein